MGFLRENREDLVDCSRFKMLTCKVVKKNGAEPTECEMKISNSLLELESDSDLKAQLREIYITEAKEIVFHESKKVTLICVPQPLLRFVQKIQVRLVRELEKKIGNNVVIIAERKILPVQTRKTRNQKQKRPRSRTLTNVHEKILEDLCFPAEIIGKRIRHKIDGSRIHKIAIDRNNSNLVEHKLETFAVVYKTLTGK